jgi:CRISPR-associated protein Cas1
MITTCEETQQAQDVPDLVPARMLNEFAYCPRLAYLEWVQGEFADNLETLEGRFGHRRVDAPSRAEVPEPAGGARGEGRETRGEGGNGPHPSPLPKGEGDGGPAALNPEPRTLNPPSEPQTLTPAGPTRPGSESETSDPSIEPIHTRSLMLSAPREGLIAKIDLVDLTAGTAIPVDYKRGHVPDVPGNAWEPEQVQLCAHGLILREGGYLCEGGILYFVESRRRVSIPFTDELVERTRQLVRQLRETASNGVMPPPLEDSPKCPRCSLVGICLPDETRLLSRPDAPIEPPAADRKVRRLMPARDDALPLYVKEQGAMLGKSGDELTVKKSGQMLQRLKMIDVSQVSLFGNVTITAQALREVAAAGIPIGHFSYGGWFCGLTTGLIHKNVELRTAQFAAAADARRSLGLAREFVVGKIKNCRTLLRRHGDDQMQPIVRQLADLGRKAAAAGSAATLLGIEGMAAKEYFVGFARLLKGGEEFHIEGRNRRPPRDPVNSLLSFVYALLVKEWTIVLHAVGFDPMLGFYHRPRYGRPSLALDLAESFRPLVADSTVLTLVNNGEVTASSFLRRAGAVALTDAGRRAVISGFERRMDTLVTHPIFGYQISYRRVLEVQARLLGRTLLGEIRKYPSFCTR